MASAIAVCRPAPLPGNDTSIDTAGAMAVIIDFPAPGSDERKAIRQRCPQSPSVVDLHRSAFALVQMLGPDVVVDTLLDLAAEIEANRTGG